MTGRTAVFGWILFLFLTFSLGFFPFGDGVVARIYPGGMGASEGLRVRVRGFFLLLVCLFCFVYSLEIRDRIGNGNWV